VGPVKNILVILSSETQLPLKDGKTHATGFYLNEFGVPAHRLVQEGYTLTVATPKGNRPAMDAGSDVKDFFKSEEEHQSIKAFVTDLLDQGVVKLSDAAADLSRFDAVFLPGGHAPMIELMRDADLGRVLEHFHARRPSPYRPSSATRPPPCWPRSPTRHHRLPIERLRLAKAHEG